jgi:hypothetical protein
VSEFLVLLGTFTSRQELLDSPPGPLGIAYAVFAASGIILSAVYMLAMCQRVLFGPLVEPPGTPDDEHGLTPDLTGREIAVLTPIAVLCLVLGVYPKPVIDTIQPATERHVLDYVFYNDEKLETLNTFAAKDTGGQAPRLALGTAAASGTVNKNTGGQAASGTIIPVPTLPLSHFRTSPPAEVNP